MLTKIRGIFKSTVRSYVILRMRGYCDRLKHIPLEIQIIPEHNLNERGTICRPKFTINIAILLYCSTILLHPVSYPEK